VGGWREIYILLVGDAKGVSPLRKIGVGGNLILKCVLRKYKNMNGVWVFFFSIGTMCLLLSIL